MNFDAVECQALMDKIGAAIDKFYAPNKVDMAMVSHALSRALAIVLVEICANDPNMMETLQEIGVLPAKSVLH